MREVKFFMYGVKEENVARHSDMHKPALNQGIKVFYRSQGR